MLRYLQFKSKAPSVIILSKSKILSVPTYRLLCVAQGGYIVPPKIFRPLKELDGWCFSMLFIYFISPTSKRNFQNRLKNEASDHKNTFKDFFWLKFSENFVFATMKAFFHLNTWNLAHMCIFILGIKKIKVTIVLSLLFTRWNGSFSFSGFLGSGDKKGCKAYDLDFCGKRYPTLFW